MASAQRTQHGRHGLTLVELLMVITIMTILIAVAIPLIRPGFQDRYIREAARQVEAFCFGAQGRAADLGRPVGVWIERVDGTEMGSRSAVRLYTAEVPAAFTGTLLDSRVRVSAAGVLQFIDSQGNLNPSDDAVLRTMIAMTEPNNHFTIKFDYKGHTYSGMRTASDTFAIQIPLGVPPGADASGLGLPYEITMNPSRSSVGPLQLPADSVIDLSLSGIGPAGRQMDPLNVAPLVTSPVVIMFAPSGRVDNVYLGGQPAPPFAPIHLLIGRRARVVNPIVIDASNRETTNLADPTCLWVTISDRTGAIVTADNADTSFIPPDTGPGPYNPLPRLRAARELARSSAQKGGR